MTKDQVTFQVDLDKKNEATEAEPVKMSCCAKKKAAVVKKSCTCKGETSCNCSGDGVIILKASKRQFVDVNGGNLDYVGEYNEQSMKKFRVGLSESAKRRLQQHTPATSCHSISQSSLRPLKTLQVNEVATQVPNQYLNILQKHGNADSNQFFEPLVGANHLSYPQSNDCRVHPLSSERFYDVFKTEGCAEECNCGPDCACPGCLIHRTNEELKAYGLLDSSTSASTPNDVKQEPLDKTPEPTNTLDFINFQTMNEVDFQGLLDGGCLCPEDTCFCYNCMKHGILNGVRQRDQTKVATTPPPPLPSDIETSQQLFAMILDGHECGCSPEDCECFNCVKHGRVNGVRIT
jgi:hypothetical protein